MLAQAARPTYYAMHPSGVEPINITRFMNHNIGNAWEALTRAPYANDYANDLLKTQWYIRDEIENGEPLPRMFSNDAWATYLKIIASETDEDVRKVFACLYEYQEHGNKQALWAAEQAVVILINRVSN